MLFPTKKLRLAYSRFEHFIADVIYDRRKGKRARFFAFFLHLLSYIFRIIVKIRLIAYRKRWIRSQHLGCMVIVVGNLTVGGTGKTPVVEKIARCLLEQGRHVAILSRGYKSKSEHLFKRFWRWLTHIDPPLPKVVSDGKTIYLNSEESGDEPYLLARNLKNVSVVVDKDRVKAGNYAIRHLGVDVLVLDDGFQYFQLKASHYLTLVDATNPFGNGSLLPRGILREPLKHLRRSSYVFLTKSDEVTRERLEELKKQIRHYHRKVEFIECVHAPQYLQDVFEDQKLPLSHLAGLKAATISAIAMPDGFERFLKQKGVQVVYNERHTDHYRFTTEDLQNFYSKAIALKVDCIITTEKDAVRIPDNLKPNIPFYFLRMEIKVTNGIELFEKVISQLSCNHLCEVNPVKKTALRPAI